MTIGQRRFLVLIMTVEAGFFCLFFALDSIKAVMNIVMGQGTGCLFRGIEEKEQDAGTEKDKQYIDDQQANIFFLGFMGRGEVYRIRISGPFQPR